MVDARSWGVLFERLYLLADLEPRSAFLAMAIDEVLLTRTDAPILRVYGWRCPAVSIGYFDEWKPVALAHPERELVRRWTGGGVVLHGEDWTYSLIVPRGEQFARVAAAESYKVLHEKLADAFRGAGVESHLTPQAQPKISRACFENPAQHDLLAAGRKIAGAAQRRSRFGLLHQGSIQDVRIAAGFEDMFASVLSHRVLRRELSAAEMEEAHRLVAVRYGTEQWNRKY